ncbi:MAG: hypothetical protein ACLGHE_03670 [Gammaproteobacteria bacterium]
MTMIELFREYWWAAVLMAAAVVVVTHAGLVKLVAVLQESDRRVEGRVATPSAPGARDDAARH